MYVWWLFWCCRCWSCFLNCDCVGSVEPRDTFKFKWFIPWILWLIDAGGSLQYIHSLMYSWLYLNHPHRHCILWHYIFGIFSFVLLLFVLCFCDSNSDEFPCCLNLLIFVACTGVNLILVIITGDACGGFKCFDSGIFRFFPKNMTHGKMTKKDKGRGDTNQKHIISYIHIFITILSFWTESAQAHHSSNDGSSSD